MQSYARKSEFNLSEDAGLKDYQSRFLIRHLAPRLRPGARVLEVGAGERRETLDALPPGEKWVADEYKGAGSGPLKAPDWPDVRFEFCRVGANSERLPSGYFDAVFSLSALEHVDPSGWQAVTDEVFRITRAGGVSLHCIDAILRNDFDSRLGYRDCFLRSGFRLIDPASPEPREAAALADPDLFVLSERMFERWWRPKIRNRPSYKEFGMPTSLNLGFFKPE